MTPSPRAGELALLYSKQRAAMVVAQSDGVLWSLHRASFRGALRRFEFEAATVPEPEIQQVRLGSGSGSLGDDRRASSSLPLALHPRSTHYEIAFASC